MEVRSEVLLEESSSLPWLRSGSSSGERGRESPSSSLQTVLLEAEEDPDTDLVNLLFDDPGPRLL
jgi:hypothetical protein